MIHILKIQFRQARVPRVPGDAGRIEPTAAPRPAGPPRRRWRARLTDAAGRVSELSSSVCRGRGSEVAFLAQHGVDVPPEATTG